MGRAATNAVDGARAGWVLGKVIDALRTMDDDASASLIEACGPAVLKWAEPAADLLRVALQDESTELKEAWLRSMARALISW